jgi:hypothetical protein
MSFIRAISHREAKRIKRAAPPLAYTSTATAKPPKYADVHTAAAETLKAFPH